MVDFLFFFQNSNKFVALIIKRKHSIRVIGTAYSNRADSIIFENGKARYITPSGEIGRSIFVYSPATKAWNYFDKEGNRVTGRQYIDGNLYYFKEDDSQAKGEIIEENGIKYYYEPGSGVLASGCYLQVGDDQWMYFKQEGSLAIGQVRADGGLPQIL